MKTAIIGAGRMGQRHIENVLSMDLELVGICDAKESSLEQARQSLGVSGSLAFQDLHRMLEEKRPECVIVSTTAPSHCEIVLRCIEEGVRKILCEKPMAVSLEECDRMIEAAEANGVDLAVNHQMRFMDQYTLPKKWLESEEFGGVCSIAFSGGNFGLCMNGCHYFEMLRFVCSENVDTVTAWFSDDIVPNPRGSQFEDRGGQLRATTPSGKRLAMDIGTEQGQGMICVYNGKYGQVIVDELSGFARLTCRKDEFRALPTTRYGSPFDEKVEKILPADALLPSRKVLEALVKAEDYPNGCQGRHAVACVVAAYESEEKGNVAIRVDGELPRERRFPWA